MRQGQQHERVPHPMKRWILGALTLAIALTGILPAVQAADYLPDNDPLYTGYPGRMRLAPGSQGYDIGLNPTAPFTWGNGIPNALADYYTFTPLSNADALKVGFPAACGNKNLLTAGDPTSTADCYIITVKRMNHNFELKSILDYYVNTYYPLLPGSGGLPLLPNFSWPGTTTGLKNPAASGANFSATAVQTGLGWVTDTQGYGSGGTGWRPPYIDPLVATAPFIAGGTITGSAPAFFKDFPIGLLFGDSLVSPGVFTPGLVNGIPGTTNLNHTGIWHFPAPSIKGTKGRPILVQWLNELPNAPVPGMDPTLDCGAITDCFPYNRITTHVHGGHVGPGSDGLAPADYTPNFAVTGAKYATANTERLAELRALPITGITPTSVAPTGTHVYPMNQEAATIWYHDHAMGATHTNTNQGMAGFFPITDENEKCLQGIATPVCTPAPAAVLPTGAQELGFALQDRLFDDKGQFYMPDAPIIDANFPTCDKSTAGSRAATCNPLYMYAKHLANLQTLTVAGIHLVPYNEATLDTTIPENAEAPVLGPSTTLEYFGNMPVVNGVVYGKYDVDRKLYRMRFIGGTDSRTWTMQLNSKVKGATTVSPNPIPFYVIGSEQGFLNTAVPRTQITLMPGERIDVLVDFRDVPAGDNQVVMANYNSDGPFQGIDNGAISTVLSVDIPEIMAFDVSNTTDLLFPKATYTTAALRNPAWGAAPLPAAGTTPFPTLLTTNNVRVIGLEEIVDQYGRTMPTIDRRGYAQPGFPATEIVKIMDVEEWDIINTTADAHPMHLHQVAFQIVSRTPFDTVAFFKDNTAAINQVATNVFLQPSYVATGPPIPPGPFENGWKDTAFTPPGFVTKLRAKFDLLGEYVWHCHILSHEEHDMMRPLKVVSLTSNPPTSLTVPAASAIDRTAMVTIVAPAPEAAPGPVTHKYIIEYTQQDSPVLDIWHPVAYFAGQNTLTPTILFPHDGIFALRIKAADATISPIAVDSAWVAGSGLITVTSPTDAITGPAPGALPSSSPTFTITTSNVLYPHTIWVGTTPGGSEIGKFTVAANVLSIPTSNLPTTGIPLYVRLIVSIPPVVVGGLTENRYKDYLYTAANIPNGAVTATTTAATAITSSGFTAHWTVTTGTPTGYFLDVSTSSTFATFLPGFNGRNVGNVTTFALTGLSPATTYYYRVRPHDAVSTGAVSNATTVVRFAKADFNGDIKSDILWRDTASGDVGLWLMNGTNALSKTVVGNVPTNLTWSIAGRSDINGDGKSDILWREAATGNVALWLMNGSTVVSKPLLGNVVSTMTFAATADFNGDGKADILWRDSATGDVTLWLMNGTSVVSSTIVGNVAANLTWAIAGTGDFDGNGHADILWREAATGDVAIWLMNGTAVISKAVVGNVAANLTWSIAATGDFDGDGKSDILLREAATGDVGMWVMNGTTVVSKTIVGNVATNLSWTIAGTGDFNGDGKSEILWRGTVSGDVGMWVMNGTAIVSKTVVGNVPVSWNISN